MITETKVKILGKNRIAKDTYEIKFEKPKDFDYAPGQYVILKVSSKMTDGKAPVRAFSLSSSPKDNFLSTCFRYDEAPSDFKKALIENEKEIEFRGPLGKFTLPKNSNKPITLIAGGVGITPFISMIKSTKEPITLIYTDKSEERMAYLEDLKKFPSINLITRTKRVDKKFLKENANLDSVFYICGGKQMVEDVEKMLKDLDVNEEDLRLEKY